MKKILLPTLVLSGAMLALNAPRAQAQTTGSTNLTLNTASYLNLTVDTESLTFNPTQSDYDSDSIALTGSSGVILHLRTNDPNGAAITVEGDDSAGPNDIELEDIQVRSQTPGGVSDYFTLTDSPQVIWSTDSPKPEFSSEPDPIQVDVKINDLRSYPADDTFNNTLTFTAVPGVGEEDGSS